MARVLIVDDDQAILDATKLILEYEGYEVMVASNRDTVQRACEDQPDIILLDIWLSGADGTEIAQFLKEQSHTSHIPIILFSANRNVEGLVQKTGVEDALVKPFNIDELLQKIQRHTLPSLGDQSTV